MKEYAAGIESSELRLMEAAAPARSQGDAGGTSARARSKGDADGTSAPLNGRVEPSATRASPEVGAGRGAHLSLVAIDTETKSRPAPMEAPPEAPPAGFDRFLIAATKEFDAGIVEQPLWVRALAQADGDRTRATQAYLRARATALRVEKREKRQERSARRARALGELGPDAQHAPAAAPSAAPRRAGPNRKHVLWIGVALASCFVIAVWFAVPALQHDVVKASVSTGSSASSKPSRPAAPKASDPANQAANEVSSEDFAARLQTLKKDGNWNVVVLYAVEWAHKQPANPDAWRELSAGYVKLRQYRDALDAAGKLVQLAPEDAAAWRNLAQVNVALQQPADALAAFEQAVARDDRDVASIVQTGVLDTQLGRFPDARLAFARALAVNPRDVEALCGAVSLAQKEGRAKDVESITRQVAALDNHCREATAGETVRVTPAGSAGGRFAASAGR
jgi:tetratricopeptide (TPR) repeat protein